MKLDDAIFNWLQIKYVKEQRPNDQAAQETYQFFTQILTEDHKLENILVQKERGLYLFHCLCEGEEYKQEFPVEFVQQLFIDIESEPKYNE